MGDDEQVGAPIDPLEVEIRFRRAGSNYDPKVQDLMDDISNLGRAANSIVPEIVRSCKERRSYINEEVLVRMYEATRPGS